MARKDGRIALRCAADDLKSDGVLVLEAVRSSGTAALEYASVQLQNDNEFPLQEIDV